VTPRSRLGRKAERAFTLIEMLAVVLIMALLMSFFVPNLGASRGAAMLSEARKLAAHLELARQRAVMTGKIHRVLIDLESGGYRLEWYVNDADVSGEALVAPGPVDLAAPLDLTPSTGSGREFAPIPTSLGDFEWIDERFYFDGVESADGWVEGGEVEVRFQRDGTADASDIVLMDADDRAILLEVRPFLEVVRIIDEG
jgi:prepilin-type N-terminal cleavage/methylation domain-containing protein